jgi:hypothetical protein
MNTLADLVPSFMVDQDPDLYFPTMGIVSGDVGSEEWV